MKFYDIKRFSGKTIYDVLKYLSTEFNRGLRDIAVGLTKLTFLDNFDGFEYTAQFEPNLVVTIPNVLGSVPRGRLITRVRVLSTAGTGTVIMTDSSTDWTPDKIYMVNRGTALAEVTIYFIR